MPACVTIAVTFLCPSSCHIAYISPVSLPSHRLMGRHVFHVMSVILVRGDYDSPPSLSCYLSHGMSYGIITLSLTLSFNLLRTDGNSRSWLVRFPIREGKLIEVKSFLLQQASG